MKIAWFTPFNKQSAIGRYSKFAAEALSKYADVDIFTFERGKRKRHDTTLKVIFFTVDSVEQQLLNYDIAVYNMGDYGPYHAKIYDVMKRFPGILISHDISLHNFMRYYFIEYKKDEKAYRELLRLWYGKETEETIINAANNYEDWSEVDFYKYSLSETVADNALSVIVHSENHRRFIGQYYKGDISVVSILDMNDNLDVLDPKINFNGYPEKRLHILTVGNVNKNKRIHKVIETLGKDAVLAEKYDYYIIGSLENRKFKEYLEDLIMKYDLADSVHLLGFVEHEELAYYYHGADIISNLRYPAYEGASASIVEQLVLGKACLVSNTGVYAEIADESVIKIDPEREDEELRRKLREIADNPAILDIIREKAMLYAKEKLDRDLYAKKVYEICRSAVFRKPLFGLMDNLSSIMNEMPSVDQTGLPEHVASILEELYL